VNFDDPPSFASLGTDSNQPVQSTSLSTGALTLSEALQFYCVAVGGDGDGTGGGSAFVPPSGFTVGSSRHTLGAAPGVFITYKYGTVGPGEVLTASWTETKWAEDIHGQASAWTSFVPEVYRHKAP
jgi:hypothetical protein